MLTKAIDRLEPKSSHRNRIIGVAFVLVAIIVIAVFACVYRSGNLVTHHSSPSTVSSVVPFDYRLSVCPTNGSVQQGNNVMTEVNVTYVQGSAQNVTLSAIGGPNGATFNFSNQAGTPSFSNLFVSYLTINVPASAPTGTYEVNITSTAADGKIFCDSYMLTVQNIDIQVSGTITVESSKYTFPTLIQFIGPTPTSPAVTYNATVQLNIGILFTGAITKGTFSIPLPNQERYTVIIYTESLKLTGSGPLPEPSDFTSGTLVYGSILVNCSLGVTSMTEDFGI